MPEKTFSKGHPFVSIKGKKTARLQNAILNKALDVSSISTSKLLASEDISVSKSSICALHNQKKREPSMICRTVPAVQKKQKTVKDSIILLPK